MAREFSERDGVKYWDFSVHVRSKVNPRVRVQRRRLAIPLTVEQAEKYEQVLWQECVLEVARKENQGIQWKELFEKWDHHYTLHPSKKWAESTRRDMYARLVQWTKPLYKMIAQKLVQADVEDCIKLAELQGATFEVRKKIRRAIDAVFTWGMSQKYILGRDTSPARDVEIDASPAERAEKTPLIMNKKEITAFLAKAKEVRHPWFPIWFFALHTGMRSGEINALRRSRIEMVSADVARALDRKEHGVRSYGKIRVEMSFDKSLGRNGPTKARWWRTVPINSKLYWFLSAHLKELYGSDADGERVFAQSHHWDRGNQAQVIREFCQAHGLKQVTFHTLRACFATQMLEAGVDMTSVMKIGGWKDVKTMMIYVRLAGIDEAGKTENLDFGSAPRGHESLGNVVSFNGFKGRR